MTRTTSPCAISGPIRARTASTAAVASFDLNPSDDSARNAASAAALTRPSGNARVPYGVPSACRNKNPVDHIPVTITRPSCTSR